MFWFVGSEKLETRNPKLETTTIQPLWKPPQPQSEQRQLIPPDSFFLFLPRLSGKTILSELHSGQRSNFPACKSSPRISWDLQLSGFVLAATKPSLINPRLRRWMMIHQY
jgi:hypothetical protein